MNGSVGHRQIIYLSVRVCLIPRVHIGLVRIKYRHARTDAKFLLACHQDYTHDYNIIQIIRIIIL